MLRRTGYDTTLIVLVGVLLLCLATSCATKREARRASQPAAQHNQSISAVRDEDPIQKLNPFPPLPRDLFIPDGTGESLPQVDSLWRGDPLVVSNFPERITQGAKATALYRTVLQHRHFRIFFHHQNTTQRKLKISWALTNLDSQPLEVYLSRHSQGPPAAQSLDPSEAGRIALFNWFRSGLKDPSDKWLHTLKPQESYFLEQVLPQGQTVTGMYDLGVRFQKGEPRVPRVAVSVLAYAHRPRDPLRLPLSPEEAPGQVCRGTFRSHTRKARVRCPVTRVRWLDLAGPPTGRYACPLGQEYEPALDAPRAVNDGNYGVLYDLEIVLENTTPQPVKVTCLLNAAGGRGRSVLMVNGTLKESRTVLKAFQSWVFCEVPLAARESHIFHLQFSLPGGSSGAHRLFFWPSWAARNRPGRNR